MKPFPALSWINISNSWREKAFIFNTSLMSRKGSRIIRKNASNAATSTRSTSQKTLITCGLNMGGMLPLTIFMRVGSKYRLAGPIHTHERCGSRQYDKLQVRLLVSSLAGFLIDISE